MVGPAAPPTSTLAAARAGVLVLAPAKSPAVVPLSNPRSRPKRYVRPPRAARVATIIPTAPVLVRRLAKNDGPAVTPTV